MNNDNNARFIALWQKRFGDRPTSTWSETAYTQVHLFARALQRAGGMDRSKLVEAVLSVRFDSPEGPVTVDAENNHCAPHSSSNLTQTPPCLTNAPLDRAYSPPQP